MPRNYCFHFSYLGTSRPAEAAKAGESHTLIRCNTIANDSNVMPCRLIGPDIALQLSDLSRSSKRLNCRVLLECNNGLDGAVKTESILTLEQLIKKF